MTILYNNATQEGHTGEMSRFMLQLMVESPHHFTFHTLQAGQSYAPFNPVAVEKSERVMEVLQARFSLSCNPDKQSPLLTPTAINRYMRCPLQFYYYYVCNLKELDDVEDDSIDNRIFGNIFHEAAQLIYKRIMDRNGRIERKALDDLLKNRVDIERATDEAFSKELFKLPEGASKEHLVRMMNGLQLINREVIIHYLRQLISIDRRHAPFTILGLERQVTAQLQTPHLTTTIGGFIDRLDMLEQIRVVDYKTGGSMPDALDCTEAIFEPSNLSKHSDYYLQTFIYSCIVRTSSVLNPQQLPVAPALLFIQHAGADDYNPIMKLGDEPVNDIESERQLFGQLLIEKVDSMFNPSLPFEPTSDRRRCTFCPYRLLCASEK